MKEHGIGDAERTGMTCSRQKRDSGLTISALQYLLAMTGASAWDKRLCTLGRAEREYTGGFNSGWSFSTGTGHEDRDTELETNHKSSPDSSSDLSLLMPVVAAWRVRLHLNFRGWNRRSTSNEQSVREGEDIEKLEEKKEAVPLRVMGSLKLELVIKVVAAFGTTVADVGTAEHFSRVLKVRKESFWMGETIEGFFRMFLFWTLRKTQFKLYYSLSNSTITHFIWYLK